MKKWITVLLIGALIACMMTSCDQFTGKSEFQTDAPTSQSTETTQPAATTENPDTTEEPTEETTTMDPSDPYVDDARFPELNG